MNLSLAQLQFFQSLLSSLERCFVTTFQADEQKGLREHFKAGAPGLLEYIESQRGSAMVRAIGEDYAKFHLDKQKAAQPSTRPPTTSGLPAVGG